MHDAAYREELKVFKSIAELRVAPAQSGCKVEKSAVVLEEQIQFILPPTIPESVSQRIKTEFFSRQQWPSYQSMLVSSIDLLVELRFLIYFSLQQQRAKLPIANFRDYIMKTIESSQCVVLCGETGCGKSTQVPSFILEHEMSQGRPVKIFCTEVSDFCSRFVCCTDTITIAKKNFSNLARSKSFF